jgi:asparagine synthase (glutamine-hydrolysing)
MVAGQGGLRRWRYWEPELGAPQPDPGDDERFERYRELFIDCVRRRCRSQLPVAIEVSGGLDSSAVWCAAMEASKSGGLAAPEIRAYTTTFAGDARADELAYARDVARHLRQSLHEVPGSHLPLEVVLAKGRRFSDFPGYPNSWLFWETNRKVAADGARVVLSGEGGDYWLQGSREYYAEELRRGNAQALLEVYRADWKDFGFAKASTWLLRHGVFELLPASIRFALQRLRHLRDRPTDRDEFYWLSARMRDALASRRAVSASGSAGCDPRDGQLGLWNALHSAAAMQITERAELQGALAGIEYRHPFFDHRFVQLAFTTPARLRLRGAQTKFIHRQALRTLLPPSVLRRGDKAEFSGAFRRHLDSLGNQLTGSLPATRADWVSREGMERLYRSYAGNQELGSPIWPLWGLVACDAMLEEST